MIIEYSKVIVSNLWKHIALALMFNFIWFSSMSNNDGLTLLTNDDDQLLPIMFLFAIENFLYATWLQWSKDQSNLWRQLIPSEIKLQGVHFTLFIMLAVATQLVPLMAYMSAQYSPDMYVTTSDFLGGVFIWVVALFGYGLAVMVCWWRKWTFGAVVFLIPSFWIIIFSPVCTQLTGAAIITVALIAFVFLKQLGRGLLVSVLLSFAVYEVTIELTHMAISYVEDSHAQKLYIQNSNKQSNKQWSANVRINKPWRSPFYSEPDIGSQYIKSTTSVNFHRFNLYPSLVDDTNGSADWYNNQYQLPAFIISDQQLKQKLEAGIHSIWLNHQGQTPQLQGIKNGILTLLFKNAAYVSDKSGNWNKFWSANPSMNFLAFEELPFTLRSAFNDRLASNEYSKSMKTYALMARDSVSFYNISNGVELIQTIPLPARPRRAQVQELNVSGSDIYRLQVLSKDDMIRVYEVSPDSDGSAKFTLKEERPWHKSVYSSIRNWKDPATSPLHTLIWLSRVSDLDPSIRYSLVKPFWFSPLFAAMICLFWYRREDKKVLICNTLVVSILAWPMLVVIMFCLPRAKHKFITSNVKLEHA